MAQNIKDMIKTSSKVVPMIYAYTTPGITYHDGYIKIGYTEQDVDARIWQQTHTAGIKAKKEWQGNATFDDGSGDTFRDTDFHAYLRKLGVTQPQDEGNEYFDPSDRNEWFHTTPSDSQMKFFQFRANRGILESVHEVIPYTLREEQADAVRQTVFFRNNNEGGEFLWNAKPRFGKTLSVYDFIKQVNAQRVLIVTNRPAIANSWYADYEKFIGRQGGYFFVSNVDGIKDRPLVMNYSSFAIDEKSRAKNHDAVKMGLIEFVSLQDLKGSLYFGGQYDKLKEIKTLEWDVLVIDEAHEGVDTYKTDIAFDHIKRKFTLHLSGTPFKALANDKFADNAIYNWTYADEQRRKHEWSGTGENPYGTLPQLNMFTYQMSEIIKDELQQGIEINGVTEEYAFDLNEFFETANGRFVHDSSVDKFLDALTTQEKFPFSTPELRDELKHTFWLLNRVESATLLAKKLEKHPVFKDYKIILAAGDGKLDDAEETEKSFNKVVKAIAKYDKTITLSVGQLTTGITIPEWTAVLMLSNIKSPSLYMQAAFRAQNPCLFHKGNASYRKENCYVFDFDPARTLVIFEQFANDLTQDTAAGHGDMDTRKAHIRELLNFFPVIGEDEEGEMIELDAEKVLSIPRKIKSQEVVRRGFMSDFLFQNISNVFHCPLEVIEIISKFTPVAEPSKKGEIDTEGAKDIPLDENGDVKIDDEFVIGTTPDVFGDKIYSDIDDTFEDVIEKASTGTEEKKPDEVEEFKKKFREKAVAPVIQKAKEHYGSDMKRSDEKQLERKMTSDADRRIEKAFGDYNIQQRTIEQERQDALTNMVKEGKSEYQVNKEFDKKQEEAAKQLQDALQDTIHEFVQEATKDAVKTIETKKKEREKESIEGTIRDHLRGFSRTIPSFLMAYGDDKVTLITFDQIIPDMVFREVTSISLEQFRFLRDGGDYVDNETGEVKHFDGHLFEPVVFDDSVKEFMRLRYALADYFDEHSTEDIFDYVPPQKTNQIFTPKQVVKKMVDMLEQENPGCFDMPDKTFIDLYMKSGLYITEIVKRLYQSEELKRLYPDRTERLRHIFEKQVYGLAPTEIIYKIATNFILGFDKDVEIKKHNFRQVDALPYAKEGTLDKLMDELFGK